jgi:hypothetical protein
MDGGGTHRAPSHPSPSRQHARPPVTKDGSYPSGFSSPNFLSLYLSPPARFFCEWIFLLKFFLSQIFAFRMAHWTTRTAAGNLGISVEEYEGLQPAGPKWCYARRTWRALRSLCGIALDRTSYSRGAVLRSQNGEPQDWSEYRASTWSPHGPGKVAKPGHFPDTSTTHPGATPNPAWRSAVLKSSEVMCDFFLKGCMSNAPHAGNRASTRRICVA